MKVKVKCLYLVAILITHSYQRAVSPQQYLYEYGYLNSTETNHSTLELAIKDFQKFTGLATSGKMDQDTMNMMSAPRCGMPDKIQTINWLDVWTKRRLTYKFQNWTQEFSQTQLNNILEDVVKVWTKDVNLKISESQSDYADIEIFFSEQDGELNVLGYAHYPEQGDIYFDQDENWENETNFPAVLAHELGHSLGLQHSARRNSLMFPYYSTEVLLPTPYDAENLQKLYGEKAKIFCEKTSIDSILHTNRDSHILVKGSQFWILRNNNLYSGPFLLNTLYPGLPDKIDAAFSVQKNTYFFSDNVFYRFETGKEGYKRKLISAGFPSIPSNIDAAFFGESNKTIYFFKGSTFYTMNTRKSKSEKLIVNGRKISDEWDGVPENIEAATFLGNSIALLVKNSKCYKINLESRKVQIEDCATTLYNC